MQKKRFYKTQLMKLLLQLLLYTLLFTAFWATLSITNIGLHTISRTAVTTLLTFAVAMGLLTIVYGGF
ncbi:MAG: hypothetical protein SOZ54_04565, partial [Candidatus Limiplasma sp.]|nr:hypothetical protein [Candidatus Limiplasma sp.]